MKFKSILATALAAVVAFSSCSKDENGAGPNDGSKARMNLSFTLPQEVMSRADQSATGKESKVNTISVFIFNNGVAAAEGGYTNFNNIAAQFEVSGGKYTLKPDNNIKTVAGDMTIYVAINLPSPAAYATETALLAAFDDVADLSVDNAFTMFSAAYSKTLVAYDENNVAGTTNSVSMSIDRIVSKVVATTTANTFETTWTNGVKLTYTIAGYNVYNEALDSYLVKQATTKSTLNGFEASYAKGNNAVMLGTYGAGDPTLSTLTNGYYIGENKLLPSEYGNTTYAFVATTVKPNMAAKWDAAAKTAVWSAATYTAGADIYVVAHEGSNYLTNVQADAIDIAAEFNTITANSATVYTYPEGYVHFMVYLNKNGANDYTIGRNEFIHLNVKGIKALDGVFPGYPGTDGEGEKPIDPTVEDPGVNPDPKDPKDPIDGAAAVLNVEITVNPWTYKNNDTILQ